MTIKYSISGLHTQCNVNIFAKYYFDLFFNKEKNRKEKEITTRLEKRISKLEKENISLRDDLIKCKLEHIDEVMRIERSLNTQLKQITRTIIMKISGPALMI